MGDVGDMGETWEMMEEAGSVGGGVKVYELSTFDMLLEPQNRMERREDGTAVLEERVVKLLDRHIETMFGGHRPKI